MRMPRLWSVLPAMLSLWLVAGCAATIAESPIAGDVEPSAADAPGQVRVIVTVDFGAATILAESVAFHEGMTALQALQAVADVGTTYGGGFVQSIDGVGGAREGRTDWFYSVNGVLARGGSAGLELREGDITHWDYRRWDFRRNVSATLGCFPAFLRNGYRGEVRPTVVAYGQEFQEEALRIVEVLRACDVQEVSYRPVAEVDEAAKQDANLIIVAGSDEPLVREVFGEWEKLGLFARLDAAGLEVFTSTGDATWVDGSAGLLQPLQNPWNPSGTGACENITLLVTGTDAAGVRAAVSALMDGRQRSETWCGAMVGEAGVTPLPAPAA